MHEADDDSEPKQPCLAAALPSTSPHLPSLPVPLTECPLQKRQLLAPRLAAPASAACRRQT
eukprot:4541166-Pleurochrysis_carterae.AAC.1